MDKGDYNIKIRLKDKNNTITEANVTTNKSVMSIS